MCPARQNGGCERWSYSRQPRAVIRAANVVTYISVWTLAVTLNEPSPGGAPGEFCSLRGAEGRPEIAVGYATTQAPDERDNDSVGAKCAGGLGDDFLVAHSLYGLRLVDVGLAG